jgi:hypothetical protein
MIDSLEYPALVFVRGMVFPVRSADDATQCTKPALKNGYFSGQLMVDSTGKAVKVKGAKKLHGVGPLWGYDIFLNQKIKVELILEGQSTQIEINDVRGRVLKALRGRQGWDASGDSEELIASVEKARSISQIANIVTDAYYRTYRTK